MSAIMAKQGGRVQLEQSDMHLVLNSAKMGNGEFLRTAVEETQFLITRPRTEVREEKKRGFQFPQHKKVKGAIVRHPAMLRQNQMDGCVPCLIGSETNPETPWRRKGAGAPLPNRRRQ